MGLLCFSANPACAGSPAVQRAVSRLSHMLAKVALRRELRAVYDELFGPGGAEIEVRRRREIAIGVVHTGGQAELNPSLDTLCSHAILRELVVITSAYK